MKQAMEKENSMGMDNGAAAASIAARDEALARRYIDEAEYGISQYMDLDRYQSAWHWIHQSSGHLFYYDEFYGRELTIERACEILGRDLDEEQQRLLALSAEDYDADAQDDDCDDD